MAITTITNSMVSVNAIQGTLIADNAITAVHIASNAVASIQIAENNVTAREIAANTITVAQLADDAVEADKIADGVITTNHLNKAMISSQTEVTPVAGDFVLLGDTSDSNNLKKSPLTLLLNSNVDLSTKLNLSGGTMTGDLLVKPSASGATATSGTVATFESNDNTEVSILGGSSSVLALNFGHSGDNDEGLLSFNTTSGSEDMILQSTKDITLRSTSTNSTAGDINFKSYNTTIMHIDGGNNRVGIGTASPAEELHVSSAVSGQHTRVHITKTANAGTAGLSMQSKDASAAWTIYQDDNSAGDLNFYDGGAAHVIMQSNGNVLIDGVSNYTGLEIKGSGGSRPMIQWSNANNGDLCAIYGTEGNAMTFASGSSNTAHMTLDSSGRLFVKATGTALAFQSQYNVLGVGNGTFIAEDTGISALFFNLLDTGTKYYAEGAGKMAGRIFFNKSNGSYNFQGTTVGGNAGATAGTLRNNMTLTSDGALTVSQHSGVSDITPALRVQGGASNANTAIFYTIQGAGFSGADPAMILGKHTGNNRSLNAGGTLNASGNDYAEYMYKADGCGTITKGEVCGVDVNGKLTKTFSNAISFVIKSTDPSYVGGDAWGSVDKGFTKEELEAERQKVDRIAFSGQVPVNITGSFNVGDYVYPQVNSSGIKAVAKSSPTFEEYQLCVGKIWTTMDDGRPLVAVKIG